MVVIPNNQRIGDHGEVLWTKKDPDLYATKKKHISVLHGNLIDLQNTRPTNVIKPYWEILKHTVHPLKIFAQKQDTFKGFIFQASVILAQKLHHVCFRPVIMAVKANRAHWCPDLLIFGLEF